MDSALAVHRLHFAFTVTFHYLFPQLTMGLALLIVVLKTMAVRTGNDEYQRAARFWAKIFAVNFVFGVVTGIPMEFQFGTNWAGFSRAAGAVIGQTLAMEGVFSFFLESSFLGLFIFGEKRLTPRMHYVAAFLVFLGSWMSGYLIVATDAWMQNPTGYELGPKGEILLSSFWGLLLNPWVGWQYLHTMIAAVVTGSFVMSSIGAYYLLTGRHLPYARIFVRVGVSAGLVATVLLMFPTGDRQGKNIARYQPVTLAAMEGLFDTAQGAPLVLIGQPDTEKMTLDNPVTVPGVLSFLTYQRWDAEVKGLRDYPRDRWPDNVPLLYFSYHIMVGLGTVLIALMALAAWMLRGGALYRSKPVLWMLMLALPFPYIATTAGWMTAELGRQPWLIYGLMRTSQGASPNVSAANGLFTLLGFMGLYTVLGILFLFLIGREIEHGPEDVRKGGGIAAMETLWFCLVALMVAAYVILDGFDLGAGIVHLWVARSDRERRMVIASIGPVWDGNEVWLLAAGGVLYFAFPVLYASSFSGFYLPLMIVLWLLILRGLSLELRSHVEDPLWRSFWDVVFGLGSTLLAVFFGAALGNVIRGVPLHNDGYFFLALWTNFLPGKDAGILDWYTVLVGVTALVTLTMHGALWVAYKTEGDLQTRTRRWANVAWFGVVALTVLVTLFSFWIQPHLRENFVRYPWGYIFPVLALAGLMGIRLWAGEESGLLVFLASAAYIAGMLTSAVFGVYPYVLPSNGDPNLGLTIYTAAAPQYGLTIGLRWWIPGMLLAAGYFYYVFHHFAGKVKVDEG